MRTKVDEKSQNATIVNDVVLTEKVIHRLKQLQEHDNESVDSCREDISDAICFIANRLDGMDDEDLSNAKEMIINLSFIRDYFKDLRKP